MEKTTPKITKKTLSPSLLAILKKRIAELERAEKALQIENRYLRKLYDIAPLGYQSLDENGCFMEVNQTWLDILGYSRQDVIGKNFGDFLHPDWRDHFRENFPRFKAIGEILGVEFEMVKKDGSTMLVSFNGRISKNSGGKFQQTHCIFRDITFYNQVKEQREAERRLLHICHVNTDFRELMRNLADFFKDLTGCEAVGLRMRQGEDFPYYETRGFPEDFVMAENSLCTPDLKGDLLRDSAGNPVLECMCGNILCGCFDPAKPFFTKHGSFWTNSTSELLASTTEADRKARTRNRCNGEGYESVALIPLRANNKTYGLLQFNDPRKNRFTQEKIERIEHLCEHVSLAIAKHLTDEELRNSEEKYRLLFENAQEAIIIAQDRCMVMVNPMAVKIIGYPAEELTSKPFSEFVHSDDREIVLDNHLKRLRGDVASSNYDFRMLCSDGSVKWVEQNGSLITWNGKPASLNFLTDITKRKQVENSLRENEERFRTLSDLAPVGIYLTSPDGNCQYVNPRWCEIAGLSPDEAIGKGWANGLHPEDRNSVFSAWQQMVESEGRWGLEYRFQTREGKVTWVYGMAAPQYDSKGRVIRYIGVNTDITERKRMEKKLRESEMNLRSFIDAIPESAFMADPDGTIVVLNRTTSERLGKSTEDMLGKNMYDFIPEEIRKTRKSMVEEVLRTKTPISFEDKRLNRIIYNRINPVLDPEGNITRLAVVGFDITGLKMAEKALLQAGERLSLAQRAAGTGIWDWDIVTGTLIWSPELFHVFGLDPAKAKASFDTWRSIIHPDDAQIAGERINKAILDHEPLYNEYRIIMPSGQIRFISAFGDTTYNEGGKALRMSGICVDITDRKKAEKSLREKEAMYRALVVGLPDIVMRFDREGRHLFVSDNVCNVVDLQASQFIGKTHLELGFPETQCKFWEEAISGVFDSGAPFETEYTFEGKNGPAIHNWRLIPERDDSGTVQSVLSISRDITSHRRIEQDYRMLFCEMLDGFALHEIICDSEGNPVDYRFLAVNPAFERMTNLKAGDILGRTVLEVLPGIERHWIETYGRVALTGKPVYFENYLSDLKKYFEVTAFRSAPNQFACIFADITERKRAEKELLKKTEDLSRYNKMMVGRELKMIDLKKEINRLLVKCGDGEKYKIH